MDVLCNGDEDEKNQFSFALMDIEQTGYIDFNEFSSYFSKVIAHWSSLINSHVRVDKHTIYKIFEQIDADGDGMIVYQEYTESLKSNPDLLDWFAILNKQQSTEAPNSAQLEPHMQESLESPEQQLASHGLVQIDKEKVQKILRMKTQKQEKEKEVDKLKQEILTMQSQTESHLSGLMNQINSLQDRVQQEFARKQQEKKEWEESLQRSNNLSNSSPTSLQQQQEQSRFKQIKEREDKLRAQLIDDSEGEADNLLKVDNIEARQAGTALTFGKKMHGTERADSRNRALNQPAANQAIEDDHATLRQWNQQNIFNKTKPIQEPQNNQRSSDGHSVAQSSDFHFSQFNYEFMHQMPDQSSVKRGGQTCNNSKTSDSGSRYPVNQDAVQYTDPNVPVARNKETKVVTTTLKIDRNAAIAKPALQNPYLKYENSTSRSPSRQSPNRQNPKKFMGSSLGPSASLADILNFDFNKRYEISETNSQLKGTLAGSFQPLAQPPTAKTIAQNKLVSTSPVLSVLVQLQDARETNKRNLGSHKKINIEQVATKQTPLRTLGAAGPFVPIRKQIYDDDDVQDPDSPMASDDQFENSGARFSFTPERTQPRGQQLKVNIRKQQRMERARQREQISPYQSQHASDNEQKHQNPFLQGLTQPIFPQASETVPAMNFDNSFLNTAQEPRPVEELPMRLNPFSEQASPLLAPYHNTSDKKEKTKIETDHMMEAVREEYLDELNHRNTEPQKDRVAKISKSKTVDQSRPHLSHRLSHNESSNGGRSYRPESPKTELETLSKLDEVKSQMVSWMQKIDEKKIQLTQATKELNEMSKQEDQGESEKQAQEAETEDKEEWLEDLEKHAKENISGSDVRLGPNSKGLQHSFLHKSMNISSFGSKYGVEDLDYVMGKRESDRLKTSSKSHTHKALHQVTITKMNDTKDKAFVHFGDDNWNLVLHMLFGIRQSVHSVMFDQVYELTENEFQSKYRYELEAMVEGSAGNKIQYEFYDFSPRMFNLIRSFYGISPSSYLKSIGPEKLFGNLNMGKITSLKSQCSAGKSGSLFYYTDDGLFMLKTISHKDFMFFKKIMRHYYNHLLAYPHTLVTRFVGLHKIKFTKTRTTERIYFVIMANVFNTSKDIEVRYDLKGSTYGRITKKRPEQVVSATEALKDLDWLRDSYAINLRVEQKNLLLQQLEADVAFFQKLNINDYSLLLGITTLKGGAAEGKEIEKASPNFDLLYIEGIQNKVEEDKQNQDVRSAIQAKKSPKSDLEDLEEVKINLESDPQDLLLHEQKRPPKAFFESQDGGLVSADGTQIYFLGIIDILTEFNTKKSIEHVARSIFQDKNTVSCVPPDRYGDRFFDFMRTQVLKVNREDANQKKSK